MEIQFKQILKLESITDYQIYSKVVSNEEEIGFGANGTVYKAYVNQIQPIAIKKIKLNIETIEEQILVLKKQSEYLMTLNHPNIIKTYFHFYYQSPKKENFYYIGMELLDSDLKKYLKQKPNQILSEDETTELAHQLQKGLAYLQSINSAHRDLKPLNILVSKDGTFKLCDFSEIIFEEFTIKTMMRTLTGTVSFLSPELRQALINNFAKTEYNPIKSDVFSYGLILLQCLTNLPQIGVLNQSENETKNKIQENCTKEFKEFLSQCLSFTPQSRKDFSEMSKIFELNPIKCYYQMIENKKQLYIANEQIQALKSQNEKLKMEIPKKKMDIKPKKDEKQIEWELIEILQQLQQKTKAMGKDKYREIMKINIKKFDYDQIDNTYQDFDYNFDNPYQDQYFVFEYYIDFVKQILNKIEYNFNFLNRHEDYIVNLKKNYPQFYSKIKKISTQIGCKMSYAYLIQVFTLFNFDEAFATLKKLML